MKSIALEELYAIKTAGGRNSGERSTAKPAQEYRDPAESFEYPAERERQLKAREAKRVKNFKRRK